LQNKKLKYISYHISRCKKNEDIARLGVMSIAEAMYAATLIVEINKMVNCIKDKLFAKKYPVYTFVPNSNNYRQKLLN